VNDVKVMTESAAETNARRLLAPSTMRIKPLNPARILEISKESWNEATSAKSKEGWDWDSLSDQYRQNTTQLCWFLSFYICEALGESIASELDQIVSALRGAERIQELSELDREPISKAILSLTNLKSASLTPGNRVPQESFAFFVHEGARVLHKAFPGQEFKVKAWCEKEFLIEIENAENIIDSELKDLIFIGDEEIPNQSSIEEKAKTKQEILESQEVVSDEAS